MVAPAEPAVTPRSKALGDLGHSEEVMASMLLCFGLESKVTGAAHSRPPAAGGSGQELGGCEFHPPRGTGKEVRASNT